MKIDAKISIITSLRSKIRSPVMINPNPTFMRNDEVMDDEFFILRLVNITTF